jgi:hypothetical protein
MKSCECADALNFGEPRPDCSACGGTGQRPDNKSPEGPIFTEPEPLQHTPKYPGGPCTRCGLSYSPKTSYIACFIPGDTFETWFERLPDAVKAVVQNPAGPPFPVEDFLTFLQNESSKFAASWNERVKNGKDSGRYKPEMRTGEWLAEFDLWLIDPDAHSDPKGT